jgi:hypothetical protein
MVSFMSGMAAVLMNLIYVIHAWVMKSSSNFSRAAFILSGSGKKSMYMRMELSIAISISLFLIAMPLAQLPNSFMGTL